ncbi:MAG: hypothetical protein IKY04_01965 [Lachnospiraceae bacterium]|nr:hypothetical protein [Lachnospiraceae bacterium]
MSALEILLIVAGIIIFILSFVIPAKKEEQFEETKELAKEEIKALVDDELGRIKEKVEGTVDETISYAVEKTERFMDRVSNEKIMSINEYSDTVIDQINKNHNEVMFLYDMLNEKSVNLKSTAASVDKKVKEARETKEELETVKEAVSEMVTETPAPEAAPAPAVEESPILGEDFANEASQEVMDFGGDFMDPGSDGRNEEIIRLHKAGKSNVAIAKELDMGVGEVKLVIGLFEGGKK